MKRKTRARPAPKRWVAAPQSLESSSSNRILGVDLAPGEDVQWTWTVLPGGWRYVSGYTIIPRR